MDITRLKINIEDLYLSKPLESELFWKLLEEKNENTIHSLYMLLNDVKALHYFISLDNHPEYAVTGYIKVDHAYIGKARQQIGVIPSMKKKLIQKPKFTLSFDIRTRVNAIPVFNFRHESTSKKEIYTLIERFDKKTQELCKVNMS